MSEDYSVSVYDTDVGTRFFNFNTDAAMYTACQVGRLDGLMDGLSMIVYDCL